MQIADVVSRRTDLSTFLVHLCRDGAGQTAKQRLLSILSQQRLSALNPFGPAVAQLIAEDSLPVVVNPHRELAPFAGCRAPSLHDASRLTEPLTDFPGVQLSDHQVLAEPPQPTCSCSVVGSAVVIFVENTPS